MVKFCFKLPFSELGLKIEDIQNQKFWQNKQINLRPVAWRLEYLTSRARQLEILFRRIGHLLRLPALKKIKPVYKQQFPSISTLERGRVDYIWLCLINLKTLGSVFSTKNVKSFARVYFLSRQHHTETSQRKDI